MSDHQEPNGSTEPTPEGTREADEEHDDGLEALGDPSTQARPQPSATDARER